VALVVVHRYDQIEVTSGRSIKQRICRQRSLHFDPVMPASSDRWSYFLRFFSSSEEAVFAGMWINPTDTDSRLFNSRIEHSRVAASNGSLHQTRFDLCHGIKQPDMRRYVHNPQFRRH
jgi:hypothetical protein